MTSTRLSNDIAIVTGASHGIGAAIAQRLAADGARVVVNFNSSPDAAAEVVAEIQKAGGEAVAVQADLSNPETITGLFDAAEKAFSKVTLLVNNAGVRGDMTPAAKVDLASYEKIFNANVRSPVLCMTEFAQRVGEGGGRIVNITSGQARTPMLGASLYAGTKGALEAMTRGFAADLGASNVTVNAVAPGATATDVFKSEVSDAVKEQTIQSTALGRLGLPEDIADVVAFLVSDDARWITGQVLDANGGLRRS
jgi:3-oxoacyl-[acyl-carrier protein] reductase